MAASGRAVPPAAGSRRLHCASVNLCRKPSSVTSNQQPRSIRGVNPPADPGARFRRFSGRPRQRNRAGQLLVKALDVGAPVVVDEELIEHRFKMAGTEEVGGADEIGGDWRPTAANEVAAPNAEGSQGWAAELARRTSGRSRLRAARTRRSPDCHRGLSSLRSGTRS